MPTSYPGFFLQVEKEPIKTAAQRTAYLPKTFNRCHDSMSDSDGNKKQIKRVRNCIFKFT